MQPLHLGYLALEIAQRRSREAADERLAHAARQADHHGRPPIPPIGPLRRSVARGAAAVSRGAADVARRLDRRTADELADSPDYLPGSSATA